MKVYPEKLAAHLAKGLAPIYLISGDEPLAQMECADAVRRRAAELGHSSREVYHADREFDWNDLNTASNSLSLFADQRLLDLRLPSGKPGKDGGQALRDYAARPADDAVLLITAGKLDRSGTNSAWFKAIDKVGVVVQVWPVEARELPAWVERRMRQRGLDPSREAAQLIAERVEGNLLAAAQEIDKLVLLHEGGQVDAESVLAAVSDSARYSIYDLADAALAGDAARSARILYGLRGEGVEPVLILWALAREVRSAANVADAVLRGTPQNVAMQKAGVWRNRQMPLSQALRRVGPDGWQALVGRAARAELVLKGAKQGQLWDELLDLALGMAGQRLFSAAG